MATAKVAGITALSVNCGAPSATNAMSPRSSMRPGAMSPRRGVVAGSPHPNDSAARTTTIDRRMRRLLRRLVSSIYPSPSGGVTCPGPAVASGDDWTGKVRDRSLQLGHLRATGRALVTLQLRDERFQRCLTRRARLGLRRGQRRARRGDAIGRNALAALELIHVRAREREARRPAELRLPLRVEVCELHRLGRVDLVLRE